MRFIDNKKKNEDCQPHSYKENRNASAQYCASSSGKVFSCFNMPASRSQPQEKAFSDFSVNNLTDLQRALTLTPIQHLWEEYWLHARPYHSTSAPTSLLLWLNGSKSLQPGPKILPFGYSHTFDHMVYQIDKTLILLVYSGHFQNSNYKVVWQYSTIHPWKLYLQIQHKGLTIKNSFNVVSTQGIKRKRKSVFQKNMSC